MPYQNLSDGLYLLRQKSQAKGVDHYGILDVGNRLAHPSVAPGMQPVVLHQTPPQIQVNWLQDTGTWDVLAKITDEKDALERLKRAASDPQYNLFGHNCEHFARYVATGKKESRQVQAAVAVAGLVALVFRFGK